MIWRNNEKSGIRAVQMDNLRGLLGIRRMDKVLDARIRQPCGVTKGVDENLMKVFYVGECAGSRNVSMPQKRWIDTVKDCLKKRGLHVRQERRMVHDRSVWLGFVRRNALDVTRGMNP